jgi:hypothetical protein
LFSKLVFVYILGRIVVVIVVVVVVIPEHFRAAKTVDEDLLQKEWLSSFGTKKIIIKAKSR